MAANADDAIVYVLYLVLLHFILFRNGLLGTQYSNIMSYIVALMNLGLLPNGKKQPSNIRFVSKLFQCCVDFSYFGNFRCLQTKLRRKYGRYLSFCMCFSRNIQNFVITLIVSCLYYLTKSTKWSCFVCTDFEARYSGNVMLFQVCLFLCLVCCVLQPILFALIFNYLHLGLSLDRDPKQLFLKFLFRDAIRMLELRNESEYEICNKTLNWMLQEKLQLNPTIYSSTNSTTSSINAGYNDSMIAKEYKYLISYFKQCLNSVDSTENIGDLLNQIFEQSIIQCHSTLMDFIVFNRLLGQRFLKENSLSIFDENSKNLIDSCYHRNDFIEKILIEYNNKKFINQINKMLSKKTVSATCCFACLLSI